MARGVGDAISDDACIISRSSRGLAMMVMILVAFSIFGLTVWEKKIEIMCVPTPNMPATPIVVSTSGQRYLQTTSFIYLGGGTTVSPDHLVYLLGGRRH